MLCTVGAAHVYVFQTIILDHHYLPSLVYVVFFFPSVSTSSISCALPKINASSSSQPWLYYYMYPS